MTVLLTKRLLWAASKCNLWLHTCLKASIPNMPLNLSCYLVSKVHGMSKIKMLRGCPKMFPRNNFITYNPLFFTLKTWTFKGAKLVDTVAFLKKKIKCCICIYISNDNLTAFQMIRVLVTSLKRMFSKRCWQIIYKLLSKLWKK